MHQTDQTALFGCWARENDDQHLLESEGHAAVASWREDLVAVHVEAREAEDAALRHEAGVRERRLQGGANCADVRSLGLLGRGHCLHGPLGGRIRLGLAVPQEVSESHASSAVDRLDAVVAVAEEGAPLEVSGRRLAPDAPVESLLDGLVLDHESAAGEAHGEADDEGAEHVGAPRGVLVGLEVPVGLVDVEGIELGNDVVGVRGEEMLLRSGEDPCEKLVKRSNWSMQI